MCSVFIYLYLDYLLYICICIFYLAAFKRHYALRLAIAPEFFYCSYMSLFYVCSGLLKCNMYVGLCMYQTPGSLLSRKCVLP